MYLTIKYISYIYRLFSVHANKKGPVVTESIYYFHTLFIRNSRKYLLRKDLINRNEPLSRYLHCLNWLNSRTIPTP